MAGKAGVNRLLIRQWGLRAELAKLSVDNLVSPCSSTMSRTQSGFQALESRSPPPTAGQGQVAGKFSCSKLAPNLHCGHPQVRISGLPSRAMSAYLNLNPCTVARTGGAMKRNRRANSRSSTSPAVPQTTSVRTWHPLSLQQLHQSQFIDAVNGILSGRSDVFQGSLKGATGVREEEEFILTVSRN